MSRRNILDSQNSSYLKSCRYNSQSPIDSLCPIFTLRDIVSEISTLKSHDDDDRFDHIALLVSGSLLVCTHIKG